MSETGQELVRRNGTVASLPPEVMNIVLEYCEQADCLAVLHTCRSYHEIAVPHVYRKIVINTPRQLRSFIATGQQAEFDDRIAPQFYHTRSFTYRVKNGSSAASSTRTSQPKLYTTLRDIPSHTSNSKPIFPNLNTATFEQVPADGGVFSYKTTFLSNVTTVYLEHSPLSLYDSPPDFHTLGMQDVQEIHMYHLAGCEVTHDFLLGTRLNYQASLERVHFHLSDHFAKTIGGNQHSETGDHLISGVLQMWNTMPVRRSLDTTIYIQEYADAVAMVSASVAYAQLTAHSRYHRVYPALREVIVDIGKDRQVDTQTHLATPQTEATEFTDNQLLLMRCKQKMLKYRERAERHQTQGVHVVQAEGGGKAMPDMYLLEGDKQTGWLLSGKAEAALPSDARGVSSAAWVAINGIT